MKITVFAIVEVTDQGESKLKVDTMMRETLQRYLKVSLHVISAVLLLQAVFDEGKFWLKAFN